jgi:hypothetical protein
MNDNRVNFERWFKAPLNSLYMNNDAGFIVVIISLPLLERYLRQKSRVYEGKLNKNFYKEFVQLFPSVLNTKISRRFWQIYRHGLLHQATLKVESGLIEAGLHESASEIAYSYESKGEKFVVSPRKFSERVISTIESDFSTFEGKGSPSPRLSEVLPGTGISGYKK